MMNENTPAQKPPAAETSRLTKLCRHPLVHVILIALLGLSVYSNTFQVPFHYDDRLSIIDNPVIRDLKNFFTSGAGLDYNPRRFIGYLSIAFNYRLGGLDVTGYHIFNLAVHLTTAFFVYCLCLLTFRTPRLKESSPASDRGWIALLAGLLFVAHPVQTEAVTYIIQRLASLATMFYLLALILYVQARLMRETEPGRGTALLLLIGAMFAAISAMMTKEIAFTLPAVALAYELFFFRASWRKTLPFLLPMLLVLIIPLAIWAMGSSAHDIFSGLPDRARGGTDNTRWDYLVAQPAVLVTYLRLLFFPMNQNIDHHFPLYNSLFAPPVLCSLAFLVILIGVAILLWRRSSVIRPAASLAEAPTEDSSLCFISFGIAWFFITLAVESSVIPLDDIIAEHRLYLPSIGVFYAMSVSAAFAARKLGFRQVAIVVTVIIMALSLAAWKRNLVWGSAYALWSDAVAKSSEKARPHYNLGTEMSRLGDMDGAIGQFKAALRLNSSYSEAYHNLGIAYAARGLFAEAIEQYRIALKLNPRLGEAHNSLGSALASQGQMDEAIGEFQLAIKQDPGYADAHNNLGAAYGVKGRLAEAIEHLRAAVRLKPENAGFHNNLARAYELSGRRDKAEEHRRLAGKLVEQ